MASILALGDGIEPVGDGIEPVGDGMPVLEEIVKVVGVLEGPGSVLEEIEHESASSSRMCCQLVIVSFSTVQDPLVANSSVPLCTRTRQVSVAEDSLVRLTRMNVELRIMVNTS